MKQHRPYNIRHSPDRIFSRNFRNENRIRVREKDGGGGRERAGGRGIEPVEQARPQGPHRYDKIGHRKHGQGAAIARGQGDISHFPIAGPWVAL